MKEHPPQPIFSSENPLNQLASPIRVPQSQQNFTWVSLEGLDINLLLVESTPNVIEKTFDKNESFVKNISKENAVIEINAPPPPPPRMSEEDIDIKDMVHMSEHIPLYEGDEDPKRNWFVCDSYWEANVVNSEDRKMTQFAGALHKGALTRYKIYTNKMSNSTKA